MICGACGHWNDEDEHRCTHCGRLIGLDSDSSWKRAGLETRPGPLPVGRRSGTSARRWRHEISRRLDEYRDKQRANEPDTHAPSRSGESPSPLLANVVSIDQTAAGRQSLAQAASRSIRAPMARLGESAAEFPSIPAVRREHAGELAASVSGLPPLGLSAGPSAAPIAADRLPPPVRRRPGGLQCEAKVAPLQIRTLAGVLDLAMVVVALGTFLAVFHWLGGSFYPGEEGYPDKEGFRALGIAAFVMVAFYWAFFVGHFGETPGAMWIGLRLLNFHGQKPSVTQRVARALGLILSSATLGLGFAWSFADEEKLTWHDRMSKTFLTLARPRGFQLRSSARKDLACPLPHLPPARRA